MVQVFFPGALMQLDGTEWSLVDARGDEKLAQSLVKFVQAFTDQELLQRNGEYVPDMEAWLSVKVSVKLGGAIIGGRKTREVAKVEVVY